MLRSASFILLICLFFSAVLSDPTTGTRPRTTSRVSEIVDPTWVSNFRNIALTTPSQISIPVPREQQRTPNEIRTPWTQPQHPERSCIHETTSHGCLTELVLRAYEAYNTDPEHLFLSLFQNIVEPDVVAFSSSLGPKYIRGSSEVLEMLIEGRQLGRTMISMNDVFQSQMKVVTHFTMHVDSSKKHRADAAENKIQGLAVYYFNTNARIYQVHYALDSDSVKFATGRTTERNRIVRDVINQPGFNSVVRGEESPSKPQPDHRLTYPERIRRYFDAWNTISQNDNKYLEEEFERLISKDIELRDLTWGSGKVLRNYKLVKKLFLEDWRQEGNALVSIEDMIWQPMSNRVAVRMTQIGKIVRPEGTNTTTTKVPAPLRMIAIFYFDDRGRVERISKSYDSSVLESGEPLKLPERTPRQNWREEL